MNRKFVFLSMVATFLVCDYAFGFEMKHTLLKLNGAAGALLFHWWVNRGVNQ